MAVRIVELPRRVLRRLVGEGELEQGDLVVQVREDHLDPLPDADVLPASLL